MAEDLTPAGEPVAEPGTALERIEPREVDIVPEPQLPSVHVAQVADAERYGRRFSLAYGILGGIAFVAIATVALLVTTRPGVQPAWSGFRPSGDRVTRATEIAAYVAPRYRLDSGDQIVLARASQPVVQGNVPIEAIAIVQVAADGVASGGYDVLDGSHSFSYALCGLGENCAIKKGTPSADRERLLRREALELALYTFKYVTGIDSVVVYMPPPTGKTATIALLFRKADFRDQLARPIAITLPDPVPTPTGLASLPERNVVESLTATRRYGFSFTQLQDGNAALLLDPTKLSA